MSTECGPSGSPESYGEPEKLKPRNAVTAMAFFTRAKKETFRTDNPTERLNNPEFTKQCTAEWKTLSDEERAPFVTMANADLERFEAEMQEYDPNFSNKRKRSSKEKDPNQPKRPISAFFIFSAAKREELKTANPDWKYTQIAQELGRMWNNLSEEDKKPYRDQGDAVKKDYTAKMEEYNKRKSLELEASAPA